MVAYDRWCICPDWFNRARGIIINLKFPSWTSTLVNKYREMINGRGSIALMALLKLAVLPVIGVLWTQLLTYHSPLVNEDQKMLRFVMIFLSGGIPPIPSPSNPRHFRDTFSNLMYFPN